MQGKFIKEGHICGPFLLWVVVMMQNTVQEIISFSGLGVHSALFSRIVILPAEVDAGITFVHKDFLAEPIVVGAVVPLDAMHATVLRQKSWTLSTVEHLLAALRMAGVDNAVVIIEGGYEIPILDGSAAPFFHAICRTGLVSQGIRKKFLMPRQAIAFNECGGKKIYLNPLEDDSLSGSLFCDYVAVFNHYALGSKKMAGRIDRQVFKQKIAPARTFGFLEQLPFLRSHQLAMASSLGNTLVFNADEAINDCRIVDEWLSHKILDFIGDLALLPHPFTGYAEAAQTGHAFNRRIVEHYLMHPESWVIV